MGEIRILIVEDEPVVAYHLQKQLLGLGYTVPALADSGEEAIKLVADLHPDLVLMDIRLSGAMDGIEASEHIRTHYHTPVIYLTAYLDPETVGRAKITEPYGYILKPFDSRELQITIEVALHKADMERRLRASEHWFATTLHSIGDAVIAINPAGQVTFMNPMAEKITGWTMADALGRELADVFVIMSETGELPAANVVARALSERQAVALTEPTLLIARDGSRRSIGDSAAPIIDDQGAILGVVLVFSDISERRRSERERQEMISHLEQALTSIKTLRGLIPICASCKRIRNDAGYWTNLETYLIAHSEAEFSHGICPECAYRLYGETLSQKDEEIDG